MIVDGVMVTAVAVAAAVAVIVEVVILLVLLGMLVVLRQISRQMDEQYGELVEQTVRLGDLLDLMEPETDGDDDGGGEPIDKPEPVDNRFTADPISSSAPPLKLVVNR